jgi:hypothetical protein
MLTRALVDVIRLKRDMRGIPDPKPADAKDLKRNGKQFPRNASPVPVEPAPAQEQPKPAA